MSNKEKNAILNAYEAKFGYINVMRLSAEQREMSQDEFYKSLKEALETGKPIYEPWEEYSKDLPKGIAFM